MYNQSFDSVMYADGGWGDSVFYKENFTDPDYKIWTDTDTDLDDTDADLVVVIIGKRIEDPLLSPSDSGWGGPNDSGWGVVLLPPINPQPIDLMRHFEDFVMGMVTSASDPLRQNLATNVLQTGANIFMEMMANSRTGDIGMSQLAIP